MARPWILTFGSKDCTECAQFKEYWQENYTSRKDPVLVFIDVDKTENYRFLAELEKAFRIQKKAANFPVIFVGPVMFPNLDAFAEQEESLPKLLENLPTGPLFEPIVSAVNQATSSIISYDWISSSTLPPKDISAQKTRKSPTAKLLFFQQPGCQKCARQSREFQLLKEALPNLDIASYDVTTVPGQAMLTRAKTFYGIQEDNATNLSPMVGWMKGYVTGRLATADELLKALKTPPKTPEFWITPLTEQELAQEENRLEGVIHALTWWSVIGGGLIDGINPCAFATSIFLISYLLYLKRRRQDILLVGGSFCLGVFLAYFLYGFAASYLLKALQSIVWIKLPLYGIFALSGFVLAILHLRDAIRFRKSGKTKDMDMGLSHDTHRKIHDKIKRFSVIRTWLACPAAIILGTIVSTMELACTGQVYFPILTALAYRDYDPTFFILLFVYNLCFIIPLVIITILAAFGVGAKALGDWAKRHVFSTKIAMAVLFLLLGCLMLAMAFA